MEKEKIALVINEKVYAPKCADVDKLGKGIGVCDTCDVKPLCVQLETCSFCEVFNLQNYHVFKETDRRDYEIKFAPIINFM